MVEIIAEIGVNHNGDLKTALKMIDVAKDCGADVAKFQLFSADKLVRKSATIAKYQEENIGKKQTQYNMLKKLELTYEDHIKLSDYCKFVGIEYLSTAFDDNSLDFLQNVIKQKRFKIPSGEITNGLFIAKHAILSKPLILSTGMATLSEVEMALAIISYVLKNGNINPDSVDHILREYSANEVPNRIEQLITLLHCSSEYPAPLDTVNLKSMQTLGAAFNLNYGYSDHTQGVEIAVAAVTLGAKVIEKHFTLDKAAVGPDHAASLNPDELKLMVSSIKNIEKAMGSAVKRPSISELETAKLARKSLVAANNIKKGEIFSANHLTAMRPGTGKSPIDIWDLIGKQSSRDYIAGEEIDE
ncbi:N-acetylneuraminate synthase [Planktomarina temperata]|nr:N-acetylneuraminate synthase [Planktomarina temperata]